ncbi:MAG: hypothetical protein J6A36_04790 [Clostridia bacterium]|nr:hypothetical protein [Clostridia bacterium]
MKRFNDLYDNMCKLENIEKVFKEICRNTKNKSKVYRFRKYKCLNITRIYDVLKERKYVPGPYNRFSYTLHNLVGNDYKENFQELFGIKFCEDLYTNQTIIEEVSRIITQQF